ncbi:MAG: PAS domain-containing protein [Candidatus Scalindua sediminis]|nr:PAS domain-containing protein [Candidatus Scalindua sediminis]
MPSKEKIVSNLSLIHQLQNTLKKVFKVNINTHSSNDMIQSEKFLQSVLDGIEDSIRIVDRDFNIVFLNEMAVKRAGNSGKNMIGGKCYEESWNNSKPCPHCATWKCFESDKPQQSLTTYKLNGSERYLELLSFPIKNDVGKTIYAIEFERDITERKNLEQEREEQRKELSERVQELKLAYKELQSIHNQLLQAEKLASIGQITSCLAHELDSPLTTISGHCELLEEDLKNEKALSRLTVINNQVLRCQKTIREILDFSRKSRGIKTLQDINTLIKNTISLMEHVLKVNKIQINLNLDDKIPQVSVDENQMQQVFFNLLRNSIDAMPDGGEIKISSIFKQDTNTLELSFDDTGYGIQKADMNSIFEPFFTTKAPGKGTGLGLNICIDIMKNHGGDIFVKSNEGKGTSFIVFLPVNEGNTT